MAEIGSGTGTGYPSAIDVDSSQEVNSPAANKTKARAEVVNDLAAAIIAVQAELGTLPKGTTSNVKTFLQVEHGLDGTHPTLVTLTTTQTLTNKTLTTPTIASFVNATHNHSNAAGGGSTLTSPTITTPTIASFVNASHNHQGGAGAEVLATAAISDSAITTAKIADSAVTEVKIGASAISQGKLKTASGEVSSSVPANLTLPGGEYGFYPVTRPSFGSSYLWYIGNSFFPDGVARTYIHLASLDAGTGFAGQRYIQSSPPYSPYRVSDDVPLFIFAVIEKTTGKVISTYVAPDPPWANNGKTIINPMANVLAQINIKNKQKGDLQDEELFELHKQFKDPDKRKDIEAMMLQPVSQEIKNRDMVDTPHPFIGNPVNLNHQIVVINPTNDKFCCAMLARHEIIGDSIGEILHGGYLHIDNTAITGLKTPKDVLAVKASWK